jgi:hypothetical protein
MKKLSAFFLLTAIVASGAAFADNVKKQNYLYYFGGPAPVPCAIDCTKPCSKPCAEAPKPDCPPPPPCECTCCPH